MRITKETPEAKILAEFDLENFDGSHRMDEDEWNAMLGNGYVAIYTARTDDDEIASIIALKTASVDVGLWYFFSIAVSEKYRKMGLATRMFKEAIGAEISHGVIQSHCFIDNTSSIALHKSLGFKAIQYVNDFYGEYEDAIMWERQR